MNKKQSTFQRSLVTDHRCSVECCSRRISDGRFLWRSLSIWIIHIWSWCRSLPLRQSLECASIATARQDYWFWSTIEAVVQSMRWSSDTPDRLRSASPRSKRKIRTSPMSRHGFTHSDLFSSRIVEKEMNVVFRCWGDVSNAGQISIVLIENGSRLETEKEWEEKRMNIALLTDVSCWSLVSCWNCCGSMCSGWHSAMVSSCSLRCAQIRAMSQRQLIFIIGWGRRWIKSASDQNNAHLQWWMTARCRCVVPQWTDACVSFSTDERRPTDIHRTPG